MQTLRAKFSTRLALSLIMVFLAGLGALSVGLGRIVVSELDNIAAITSERLTWNLAQVQITHLQLQEKAYLAQDAKDLHDFRLEFNIYYSRVATLRESPMFAEFRANQDVAARLDQIQVQLEYLVPFVDGSDGALIKLLPDIILKLRENAEGVRELVQFGLQAEATAGAENKRHLSLTLRRLGIVLLALVAALALTALMIWQLFHRSRQLSLANQAATERLWVIVESSLDAIVMIDIRGRIMSFNAAAEEIFDYSRHEVVGHRLMAKILPDDLHHFNTESISKFLETGNSDLVNRGRIQKKARRKSGKIFPVEVNVTASQTGNELVFVCFMRDITAHIEAEADLRRARDKALAGDRAKDKLLTVLGHEIRTPLNGILGSIELLETTGLLSEEQKYLRAMRASGDLLLHHVNEVLEMSRIEAADNPDQTEPFDLQEMLQVLVEGYIPEAQARGNQLRLRCRLSGQSYCIGNAERIQQALLRLMSNALKFTENGEVTLEVERKPDKDEVEFRVCDTGEGISADSLERIFEDFGTQDASYSRKQEGTGLGLSIARRIVEQMGGLLCVESERGEGSMFWFSLSLPLVTKHKVAPKNIASTDDTPKRILIVEDNDINRMLLEKMLQRQGYEVDSAAGGAEGVLAVENKRYNLVIMDISMPDVDGIEALRQIRSQKLAEGVEVIALTAHSAGDDHLRIKEAGFTAILTKPVTQTVLANAIRRHTNSENVAEVKEMNSDIRQFIEALGEKKAQGYLSDFCQDVAQFLKDFAATDQITSEHKSEAHRLAGSAAVLGFEPLRSCLVKIETADPDYDFQKVELAEAWMDASCILAPYVNTSRAQDMTL